MRAIDFIVIFLAGKKRKKAGKFPAFFCEPSGYFWKIFWTIVKKYIDIVTTDDGLLRIYSWDTWLGGTMHQFENLFQFKCGDKICTHLITDTSEISEVPFYSDIFTLKLMSPLVLF